MLVDEVVAHCLAKPGAEETYPFGDHVLVAKVGGKIFAFIGLDGHSIMLKCGANADDAAHWRERFPQAITVGRYLGRYGWNDVRLAEVPDDDVLEMLDGSYDDVVFRLPKSKRPAAG